MAKTNFTFDEMVYNTVIGGKNIYYDSELKTISYVKLIKDTRQVQIICTDGDVFLANQDDVFEWEVNNPKPLVQPNKSKLKGKNQ